MLREKIKTWMHFSIASWQKTRREERELSLATAHRKHQSSSHTAQRERERSSFPKKKNRKKKRTLLNFCFTNKQTTTLAFLRFTRREGIYIERLREREKGFSFRCALIFLLVIRRETRDKFRTFFFFSEPPPPANKRKSASRRRRRRRARREKALFWGIKNDVGRGRSAAAEIRLEGV